MTLRVRDLPVHHRHGKWRRCSAELSAAEALDRQEPFINNVLASSARDADSSAPLRPDQPSRGLVQCEVGAQCAPFPSILRPGPNSDAGRRAARKQPSSAYPRSTRMPITMRKSFCPRKQTPYLSICFRVASVKRIEMSKRTAITSGSPSCPMTLWRSKSRRTALLSCDTGSSKMQRRFRRAEASRFESARVVRQCGLAGRR